MAFFHTFLIAFVYYFVLFAACNSQQPTSILPGGTSAINIYSGGYQNNNNGLNIPKLPSGYVYRERIGAHKLHTEDKTWNEARNICIQEGAHLAIINSAEEEKLYKNAAHQLNADQMWIGMHDQFKEGDWVTVLDKPVIDLPYIHWILENPNNYLNSENCGTYWKRHDGWNDEGCNIPHPFYCEIELINLHSTDISPPHCWSISLLLQYCNAVLPEYL